MTGAPRTIRIGARRSPLARAQAELVAARLEALGHPTRYVPIVTHGDTDRRELTQIGGTGVFTSAVRDALLAGEVDVGVHSLKDLPTAPADGLRLAAVLEREDTRDVLVGLRLDDLRDGTTLGTGAPRRAVQLHDLAGRRDAAVRVLPVRGNVDTRIGLILQGRVDAVVLAAAGLRRLGRLPSGELPADGVVEVAGLPAQLLGHDVMLPAPGQGAIGCEIAERLDPALAQAIGRLDHPLTRIETTAERAFLRELEAGCTAPVGVRATVTGPTTYPRGDEPTDGGGDLVKSVRDTTADLTLRAVVGKTIGDTFDEPTEGSPSTQRDPAWPSTTPELINTEVIRIEGHGSSSAAADVGRRLARLALSQ
ncbi:hydroxymethylbilane synthase [Friedmanniella endophytica]|uniref:Hydroxymethylbilane synthase n=1 Tax=Microlunatus kandeliicorticis TaxID=1759536 RepID=A0A7W3IW26_9ACTN|nr:hydroxymethylbilane synthase [Microlunatus kandeliicorticis]MBA8796180.1 hydroxymethylbilane synthase [Microlunatus kandeliicorticis]